MPSHIAYSSDSGNGEVVSSGLSILIIEDDAGDFGLVKAEFQHIGLRDGDQEPRLIWAKTLAEGLAAAHDSLPDVILLDLSLPDSFGVATLESVVAALPGVPVVVFTGSDDDDLAIAVLEAGAQDYLVKGQFDRFALKRALRYAAVRRHMEQRLLENEQRLEFALASADLGMWDLDIPSGNVVTNSRWQDLMGYSPADNLNNLATWEKLIHPDDRLTVRAKLDAYVNGNASSLEYEYRMRHKDGHWVWILVRGKIVSRDDGGNPLRIIGTYLDITQQQHIRQDGADLLQRIEALILKAGERPGQNGKAKEGPSKAVPDLPQLSDRQIQVLKLVATGCTSAEIAERLNIKHATVVTHRRDLMHKLDLHSVAELTRYAIEHGLSSEIRL